MLKMVHDLAFFGLVWAFLVLAFGTATLGAIGGAWCVPGPPAAGNGPPMLQWSNWWFVRTYLQSLGQASL